MNAIAMPAPRLVPTRFAPPAPPMRLGDVSSLKDAFHKAQDVAADGAFTYQSLPSFIYPAVSGTAAEKTVIFDALSRLPLKDISAINDIRMVDHIGTPTPSGGFILGATRTAVGDMQLSRWGNSWVEGPDGHWVHTDSINPDLLRYTTLHEAGHSHDYQGGMLRMLPFGHQSSYGPWGKAPYTTDYARTNASEDFAESHAHYYESTSDLHRVPGMSHDVTLKDFDHAKWQAMHDSEQPNFAERFVDQPCFRETGKLVGEWTSGAPLARAGLAFLGSIAMMGLLSTGFTELTQGLKGDKLLAVHGGLTLAAGVGLGLAAWNPLIGPAAMACLGARRGIDVAQKVAATDAKAGTTKATTASAIGGAVGGVIGSVAGPLGATWAGYAIGGPVGGAVGFFAGTFLGFRTGSCLGAKAGLALATK